MFCNPNRHTGIVIFDGVGRRLREEHECLDLTEVFKPVSSISAILRERYLRDVEPETKTDDAGQIV